MIPSTYNLVNYESRGDMEQEREIACPACAGAQAQVFYEVRGVPTQSNRLLVSLEHARGVTTGDLRLAACRGCGLVWNEAFDPDLVEDGAVYEATQGHSPEFVAAATALARGWADRYRLEGKTIVEIGCGDGEFLALLCRTAGARGIGFDPLLDPSRVPAGPGLTYVRDAFGDRSVELPADFVCCRHTLEHIADPAAFVQALRRSIGRRAETIVAFEVPDVVRILREGAFWDIYYEHCSYWSPGSIARLFRATGFDVVALRHEYSGQYVVIEGQPARGGTPTRLHLEEDPEALGAAVANFASTVSEQVSRWNRRLDELLAAGRRLALWGSGSKAVGFLTAIERGGEIAYVVDINPRKQGTYLPKTAQEIVPPTFLQHYRPDTVIVMNPVYRAEISRTLDQLDLSPTLLTL